MKEKKMIKIETYDDLLKIEEEFNNIKNETDIRIDEDLLMEVRANIVYGKCKEAEKIAPFINRFFVDVDDILIKKKLRYFLSEVCDDSLEEKYNELDLMDDSDCIYVWLPVCLWQYIEKEIQRNERLNKFLQVRPRVVLIGFDK